MDPRQRRASPGPRISCIGTVRANWWRGSAELAAAADSARASLVGLVAAAQRAGRLPNADPERQASLLPAVTHGAVDLALAGHLSPTGKGHASPDDLAADLLAYLQTAATAGGNVKD